MSEKGVILTDILMTRTLYGPSKKIFGVGYGILACFLVIFWSFQKNKIFFLSLLGKLCIFRSTVVPWPLWPLYMFDGVRPRDSLSDSGAVLF